MRRKLAFALLGVILVSILFIAGIFFLKPEVFRKSSDKENQTISQVGPIEYNKPVEYSWDKSKMGWIGGESGDSNAEAVSNVISIEFTKEICERKINPACGFKEAGGTFEDVAKTVSYAVSLLDGKVEVNMELKDDGSYVPLSPLQTKEEEFDAGVPVRFIFDDEESYTFTLPSSSFSRGWGVDPETKGLIFFQSVSISGGLYDGLDTHILTRLAEITRSLDGNKILKEEEFDRFMNLWYGDDRMYTLKPIRP